MCGRPVCYCLSVGDILALDVSELRRVVGLKWGQKKGSERVIRT